MKLASIHFRDFLFEKEKGKRKKKKEFSLQFVLALEKIKR